MKNILLLVHDDPAQESRLQVALDVTRGLGGHLECLSVRELPTLVHAEHSAREADALTEAFSNGAGMGAAPGTGTEGGAGRALLKADIRKRLELEDVAYSLDRSFDSPADALTYASDFADLIVMSSRLHDPGSEESPPQRLPLKSERAILAVPPCAQSLDLAGTVLIAWDGSRPSVEAVRAAVPLIASAREVVMIEVDPPSGALRMETAAIYLSRHGITPDLVERSREETVAATLLDHVNNIEADLLVMGAYSRHPTVERVFGGVTRTMLQRSPVPLLLAH